MQINEDVCHFITGTVEQCLDSDSHCVQITGHSKNRMEKFEYFSCDANLGNTTLCRDGSSSQVQCFNVSIYIFTVMFLIATKQMYPVHFREYNFLPFSSHGHSF